MSEEVTFEERVKEATKVIRKWALTPELFASDEFEGLIRLILEHEQLQGKQ